MSQWGACDECSKPLTEDDHDRDKCPVCGHPVHDPQEDYDRRKVSGMLMKWDEVAQKGIRLEPQSAYIDGYSFGDRLLEGVRFRIENQDGKPVCLGVHPGDKSYMEKFSEKQMAKWREEAVECVLNDTSLSDAQGQGEYYWEDAE